MGIRPDWCALGITPERFISEAQEFCGFVANLTAAEKRRAYKMLVEHAAMLDPRARGYEGAGIALKEACSTWLDLQAEHELTATAEEVSDR